MKTIGPYELLLTLANGGMATVYLARHAGAAGFQRMVIVKRVHPQLANAESRQMFTDEAMITSFVRHPNVVPLTDVVEVEGELLLVLDYVESLALGELLRSDPAASSGLPPTLVSRIMIDVLNGLHAAHEATDLDGSRLDVIHRDVSPQNILVGTDGSSRLIDFGIAKARARLTATTSGVLKGKLAYMSPEQMKQKPLDQRSDVFSAGVVLFLALTGRRLFQGEDEADVAVSVLFADIPKASTIAPALPSGVDDVLARALARDREERFPTARAFAEAFELVLPPASAREVADLVASRGSAALGARRAAIREALDATEAPTKSTPMVLSASSPSLSEPTLTAIVPSVSRSRRISLIGGMTVAMIVSAGIASMAMTKSRVEPPVAPLAASGPPIAADRAELAASPGPAASTSPTAGSTAQAPVPTPSPPQPSRVGARGPQPQTKVLHDNPYSTPR